MKSFSIAWILSLLLLFTISRISDAQTGKLRFEHLTIEDGLSHNIVGNLIQDSKGYLWFGTSDGLNKYDGYSFTTYKYDPRDTTTLSHNEITAIWEDQDGTIWIGTLEGGICKFDRHTETFTRYQPKQENLFVPELRAVSAINEDKEGFLWVGNFVGELRRFNKQTGEFSPDKFDFDYRPGNNSYTYDAILCIFRDKADDLWFGNTTGLHKLELTPEKAGQPAKISFTHYQHDSENPDSLSNSAVMNIYEDHTGILWIGTDGGGLNSFDRKTGTFTHYLHNPQNPYSISSNIIWRNSIAEDQLDNLWIGTWYGLNKLNKERTQFTSYAYNPTDPASLSSNQISGLLIDKSGILWIATLGGGINKADPHQKPFKLYRHNPFDANSLSSNAVTALYEDKSGILWIGMDRGGLNTFDKKTGTFTHFRNDPANSKSLSSNFIVAILEDQDGKLWIIYDSRLSQLNRKTGKFINSSGSATLDKFLEHVQILTIYQDRNEILWLGTHMHGLISFDRRTEEFIQYQHDPDNPQGISDYKILSIYEDTRGNLWIGTGSVALNRLDRKTGKFTHYRHDKSDSTSISSNIVKSIFEDSKGNLWFGTSAGGLCRFDYDSEIFTTFTEKQGLANNTVYSILEDNQGNLWLGTGKGLSRFSPTTQIFTNYDANDGLQSKLFHAGLNIAGACFKGKDGTLYFGGINGFNAFNPHHLRPNQYKPPVVITEFKLFDKPLPGKNEASEIVLDYDENFFSFEFSTLNYTNTHKNQYAYMLENFDKDWIYSENRRYASYTNLDPGEYVFRVKGSNNDGVWNEEGASIKLMILPPFWQTWWAYSLYGIIGIWLLYSLRQHTVKRERLKHALKLQTLEAEKMHEIDHMKSRFFANISHEFRTPLTLILGPLEELLTQSAYDKEHSLFSMMQRNAQRLLHLINQLLDLSKLEAGSMKLETKPGDIVAFLKAIVFSFTSLAERRQIQYHVQYPVEHPVVYFDADKLEKIITNLLSNAFKFTPDGGSIAVSVSLQEMQEEENCQKQLLEIKVADSGVGIPAEQIDKVFDRFYQVDSSRTREKEGAGIGLALTKELVELHGGEISIASQVGKRSTFTVRLPLEIAEQKAHPTEQFLAQENGVSRQLIDASEQRDATEQAVHHKAAIKPKAPLLLLVEDNADVRNYMRDSLIAQYQIIEATHGAEALEQALQLMPDLIVSDVMMPVMDGIALCHQLKTNIRTSHIPVILLTAKAGEESRIEGLETGADDYLTKPFSATELKVRIKNLLEQRARLKEYFSKRITVEPKEIAVSSVDEKFLQSALAIIEANMANADFDVEMFGRDIGMSRAQLHRKLKALTDLAPGDFIRTIRLKRAAALLSQKAGNVSEVAYLVGFKEHSYFSRCFHQTFGCPPSEYVANHIPI